MSVRQWKTSHPSSAAAKEQKLTRKLYTTAASVASSTAKRDRVCMCCECTRSLWWRCRLIGLPLTLPLIVSHLITVDLCAFSAMVFIIHRGPFPFWSFLHFLSFFFLLFCIYLFSLFWLPSIWASLVVCIFSLGIHLSGAAEATQSTKAGKTLKKDADRL